MARWNAMRRGKYLAEGKAYAEKLKGRHFFRWRARNWSRYGKVTALELARLWKSQRGLCALSGRKLGRDAHLDHVTPKARGGRHVLTNLRWLDPRVNEARRAMTDAEFAAMCAQVAEWIGRRILASA